ncbi:cytosine permease [Streptomyces sp. NPDC049954]|uniref:purine-cytosine permease family protein n=1 Tax=Streptomyces sp. NPDC049954 TaxID=3155779 RepID=UPI003418B7E7
MSETSQPPDPPLDAASGTGPEAGESTVETRGIEPVPDHLRGGRPRQVFPLWVSANISVLLVTIGAGLIVAYGLNFWQVLGVALVSPVVAYGLVGLVSIAGKRGGAPGMTLSRAVFGQRGNLLPGTLIWVTRWGWETVNAVTGAYACLTVLDIVWGLHRTDLLTGATLVGFVACTFLISGLGRRVLQVCTSCSMVLFGLFSVLILVHLVRVTDWTALFARPAGPSSLMVAGFGAITAGGISWVPTAPDFTRYLPRAVPARALVGYTVAGALVVVTPLVLMGAVVAVGLPHLSGATDPVSFLGEALPTWIAVPYLVIALVGMVLINAMSMYSAGFTALTLGLRVPRAAAVSVNAVISLILGWLLMNVATGFLDSFLSFLSLLAVAFSAWIGVFGTDLLCGRTYDGAGLMDTGRGSPYWYRNGFSLPATTAWACSLVVGLLFTRVEWFSGPFASSWVGRNGLGWLATVLVAGGLYALMARPVTYATGRRPGACKREAP